MIKICEICNSKFETKSHTRIYCYNCSGESTRNNNETRKHQKTILRRSMKIQAIKLLGGKCSRCGYNRCIDALEFHHENPNEKEFKLGSGERKIGIGHNNFNIETNKKITIEEDLERRDITINAIAKEILTDKIIDPFNGIKDLNNKIIRAVSSHFIEDPLRVYRVSRFASQFDFNVENNTIKMMKELKNELSSLAVERVNKELTRALLTNKPSKFFDVLKNANVLDIHFKEIYDLIGAEQPLKYHPEGDSYNHTVSPKEKKLQAKCTN